jgi:hypothetical protein
MYFYTYTFMCIYMLHCAHISKQNQGGDDVRDEGSKAGNHRRHSIAKKPVSTDIIEDQVTRLSYVITACAMSRNSFSLMTGVAEIILGMVSMYNTEV